VVADALDHGDRAGVAHRETLAGLARGIQFAAGGAVQTGVAENR
jgi:hypothetical protein